MKGERRESTGEQTRESFLASRLAPLRVAVVLGTRPEAVKLAPVILEMRTDQGHFSTEVILTGQHRQLAREILAGFGIAPDLDLDIMTERQSLTQVTVRSLK